MPDRKSYRPERLSVRNRRLAMNVPKAPPPEKSWTEQLPALLADIQRGHPDGDYWPAREALGWMAELADRYVDLSK